MSKEMPALIIEILCIAAGGAAGSVARYGLQGLVQYRILPGSVFPWGTLVVNLLGSLAIGFLYELGYTYMPNNIRLLVFVGILGGFTTFSSFGLETFNLIRDGEAGRAALNVLASNVIGIALVFVGFFAARWLVSAVR